jgi:tRNA A58 N-methylase Trm61
LQEHVKGRGNTFVHDAIVNDLDVVYRYLEADGWTDPATMEVEHLAAYQARHGARPPGNGKNESLPHWWKRARVVIGNWAE